MKLKKSDIKLMAEIIIDYKYYIYELSDGELKNISKWLNKVDKLDSKLWDILNNKNIEIK